MYDHPSEGFCRQTVPEFGLALTLCGLRRIPQLHREIIQSQAPWNYEPPEGQGRPERAATSLATTLPLPAARCAASGCGSSGRQYRQPLRQLRLTAGSRGGAWDPFATEPCFHRAGSRREYHLEQLVADAEVFAPMVPLTESTRGLVEAEHINALPKGWSGGAGDQSQDLAIPTQSGDE